MKGKSEFVYALLETGNKAWLALRHDDPHNLFHALTIYLERYCAPTIIKRRTDSADAGTGAGGCADGAMDAGTGGDQRERETYIFPWLQVRITGPRHHLTSSLRSYAQGCDKTDLLEEGGHTRQVIEYRRIDRWVRMSVLWWTEIHKTVQGVELRIRG